MQAIAADCLHMQKLARAFFNRDTIVVAKQLLGKYIIKTTDEIQQVAKIVEVEAYLGPHDKAAHSARGLTPRTTVMYGEPGHAYVYLIYGIYNCFNIVTEPRGHAAAVLIRAVEPIQGIQLRTSGPGLLCKALEITRQHTGHDLQEDNFYIASGMNEEKLTIVKRPRIGVDYAGAWAKRLLRFYIKGNKFISKP